MTTNLGPEEPRPEAARDQAARDKQHVLTVIGWTSIPIWVLCGTVLLARFRAGEWDVFFSGMLFISTVVQVVVAALQRKTMVQQMEITRHQLKLTEGEFEQTKVAAEAATKSAQAAFATVEQMRLDQRAWLSTSIAIARDLRADGPYGCRLLITNSGRTPGTIIRTQVGTYSIEIPYEFANVLDEFRRARFTVREQVVPPSGQFNCDIAIEALLTPALRAEISANRIAVFLLAIITYLDIFGNERHTNCCFHYNHATQSMFAYGQFNTMD